MNNMSHVQTLSQAQADLVAQVPKTDDINAGCSNTNPPDITFWSLVGEDFVTHNSELMAQGFWALFWHRFGNLRMAVRPRLLRIPLTVIYLMAEKLLQITAGIYLPYTVVVGRRVKIEHFGGMILVARAIGDDVVIRQNTTFGVRSRHHTGGRPTIGDRVELGAGVVITGPVSIGADAVVGANAVVTRDVPQGITVVGVPARPLDKSISVC
ncbi:MAG: serine O-acetyltransferase [Sedimentitalea sp.]